MNIPTTDLRHEGYSERHRSGRKCLDCGEAAGTKWTPYWCPRCDIARKEKITRNLAGMVKRLEEKA